MMYEGWPWTDCAMCGAIVHEDDIVKRPQPDRICRTCFDASCCQVCGGETGEMETWGKDLVHPACKEEVLAGPLPEPYDGPGEEDVRF